MNNYPEMLTSKIDCITVLRPFPYSPLSGDHSIHLQI